MDSARCLSLALLLAAAVASGNSTRVLLRRRAGAANGTAANGTTARLLTHIRAANRSLFTPADEGRLYAELDNVGNSAGEPIEGHSNQFPAMTESMNKIASDARVKTVCETGFNGGHSSLRWLLHSGAKVYSFDLGVHTYSAPRAKWLQEKFPGRIEVFWGNSITEVPKFFAEHPEVRCNLVYVDGGHSWDVAEADLNNFKKVADPEYNVLLMDDVYCIAPYCEGPHLAWTLLVDNGVATETEKHTDATKQRGYAIGRYKAPR